MNESVSAPHNQAATNSRPIGLTSSDASARLESDGPNELPSSGTRSLLAIVVQVLREPMFALLLAAGIIYLALGDLGEALVLLAFASMSVFITIVQEWRSERVLESLRSLTSPRALVIRDGQRQRIPGREVVRGDLLIIAEGDRVAADARLLSCSDLQIDESLLTGESVAARKRAGAKPEIVVPSEEEVTSSIYSGTLVVRGQGLAEVVSTGVRSRIGQIGKSLGTIEIATPRLTKETRRVVRWFAIIGFLSCALTVVLFGLYRGTWLDAFLAGIALGMSMLPEEFPLVLAVFMVMGAWRLSRARVLTRRAPAIETLGSATVLCTDKTGTLTENRMTVVELRTTDTSARLDRMDASTLGGELRRMIEHGVLASAPEPFDPMERAFHRLHTQLTGRQQSELRLTKSYPIQPELLAVTQAWSMPSSDHHIVSVKGAPEAILALCRAPESVAAGVRRQADEMALDGLRVLGVAEAVHSSADLPDSPWQFDFQFLGLVGLADPLRTNVPNAVRECHEAGIRVIMITGDHPQTARAIALQAGIDAHSVLTGPDIQQLSRNQLATAVGETSVFARILPEQKLRLVDALKQRGEIVAMTGDGVNDAPALRAADIGVAMGGRGTDVAREASSIVLLDDDFNSIVTTIRLGRRIYDNLRKAMTYIMAIHIPIAGLALLPLLTGFPIVLWPLHIAFLEMAIDPACSIVFEVEKEEADIMRRRPRAPGHRLLSANIVVWSLIQGCLATALLATIYLIGVYSGTQVDDLRGLTFVSLVLVNISLVLVNRSYGRDWLVSLRANIAFLVICGGAVLAISTVIVWRPAASLFGFGSFQLQDLAVAALSTSLLIALLGIIKGSIHRRLYA